MNPHAKGYRNEKKTQEWLESMGFLVYKPPWNTMGEKDMFGCWDLVAVDPDSGYTVWVQVKTNALPPPAERWRLRGVWKDGRDSLKLLVIWKDRVKVPRVLIMSSRLSRPTISGKTSAKKLLWKSVKDSENG